MNTFLKSFIDIFNLFPSSKSYDEYSQELDEKMQDFYDKMGWGKYSFPIGASNSAVDLNKVLEAEQSLMNEIYGYNLRKIVTKEFHKPLVKDPARRRVNKYL